jgi:4'-phosphopantetheinyl transferase
MFNRKELLATRIDGVDQTVIRRLCPYVSHDMQNRLQRFRLIEDQVRSLFGEILVRIFAIERWNIPNSQIEFVRNKYAKPALLGNPNFNFNISHSGEWVVAAFDTSPIGIDIEYVQPIELTIADRYFTQAEIAQLYDQPLNERLAFFYKLWTLKESFIKAVGKGLSMPLHTFSFRLINGDITVCSDSEMGQFYFQQYQIDADYQLAVCGTLPYFPKNIQISPWSDMVNYFERLAI